VCTRVSQVRLGCIVEVTSSLRNVENALTNFTTSTVQAGQTALDDGKGVGRHHAAGAGTELVAAPPIANCSDLWWRPDIPVMAAAAPHIQ